MYIGIVGTRGIPNYYGGFEQFAEYLSTALVERGHKVVVYNSHSHPFKEKTYKGVEIARCLDPEDKIGTAGQFIYDFNCILDSRSRGFDLILQLGYTSNSIWGWLLPGKPHIVTNMDGLEWKRSKFSPRVQKFLKKAEGWAVKSSDFLVSDSIGIQEHLEREYKADSTYIPYGSHVFSDADEKVLAEYSLSSYNYNMLVARLEPENSIEPILDGVASVSSEMPFLVIGKNHTAFGQYLTEKYRDVPSIRFLGGIYDINKLNNLRYFSNLYFHGHTVGGTNPSLLEAMGSHSLICAHDNIFNRAILEKDAFYFTSSQEVGALIRSIKKGDNKGFVEANLLKIETTYSWQTIVSQYEELFKKVMDGQSKK